MICHGGDDTSKQPQQAFEIIFKEKKKQAEHLHLNLRADEIFRTAILNIIRSLLSLFTPEAPKALLHVPITLHLSAFTEQIMEKKNSLIFKSYDLSFLH